MDKIYLVYYLQHNLYFFEGLEKEKLRLEESQIARAKTSNVSKQFTCWGW